MNKPPLSRANPESLVLSRPVTWFVLGALLIATAMQPPAHAITISMEYTDEGDTPPHDENPSWDPAGLILKAHFQAAKAIWESLLPGPGTYSFDFHWDDNIDGLGLYTPGVDEFIEINPNANWYADPFPADNSEFSAGTNQTFFSGLSASDQSTYFPGTAPPGALETRFNLTGSAGAPGAGGFDAASGFDLLTVILHEIGHALGIEGVEPGEYNILPQHVGGLNNVLVLEDDDSGHLAGDPFTPGFLMCEGCELIGRRRLPSATDVLVIAEDQGINDVRLARVGRITSGLWSDAGAWIGGAVPAFADVYISHGGTVTLDAYAVVRSVNIFSGANSLQVQNNLLNVDGPLTFTGATVSVGAGGTLMAANILGDPASLTTTAGSTVLFNQLTVPPATTSVTFNGSVGIGIDPGFQDAVRPSITFNPGSISTWNIGEGLFIGNPGAIATVTFNNGSQVTSGTASIGSGISGQGHVVIDGFGSSWTNSGVFQAQNGSLTLTNAATLTTGAAVLGGEGGGQMHVTVNFAAWEVNGNLDIIGPAEYFGSLGGTLTVQDVAQVHVDGNITIRGTSSFNSSAVVQSNAFLVADGDIFVKSFGVLRYRDDRQAREKIDNEGGAITGGTGGITFFHDTSSAINSEIHNRGSAANTGAGGRTTFLDSSTANNAAIHNHGATFFNGGGGVVQFRNNSTAGAATVTNYADGTYYIFDTLSGTSFFDSSNAGTATIENQGSPAQSKMPGRTEFRHNSSAANATIHNRAHLTVGDLAGRTTFYDSATAANATINLYGGYSDDGRIEFRNSSTAANATIVAHNIPTIVGRPNNGGRIFFYDNATAAQSQITLRQGGSASSVQFHNNATAASAQIVAEETGGSITFFGSSTAANATISLGRSSLTFFNDSSTAANATLTLAHGAQVQFQHNSSAGQANIVADGSSLYPWAGGRVLFNSTSLINNTTIVAHGGSASLAAGATVEFINGAHAGNATITANGPTNGGTGAQIMFNAGAKGDNAQLIANAGASVDFMSQRFYGDGSTSVGSIEGAGTVFLRGSHLITGSLNLSRTISGPITDAGVAGGRLTKVGTGTLTLSGTNNYSGLTTVSAGTLSLTGSIPGSAVVNNGGTLNGTGTIGGNVTVNSGGILAPGISPGIFTIGSLTMNAGSTLQMEIGGIVPGTGYDRIQSSGALALGGALQVSLIDGFTPTAGQSFDLFNWGSTSGTFASLTLPSLAGLAWNTSQLYTSGVISVASAALPGDFNNDGAVNAADYVAWRKGVGVAPTPENYNLWRANFGPPAGGAASASANATVPESATSVLVILAAIAVSTQRRCRTYRMSK